MFYDCGGSCNKDSNGYLELWIKCKDVKIDLIVS